MSRPITIAASLLCLASAASFAKSDNNTKALALNLTLTSAAVAFTSEVTTALGHTTKKDIFTEAEEKLKEKIKALEHNERRDNKIIAEIKKFNAALTLELTEKTEAVLAFEEQIDFIKNDYQQKIDEIDRKLQVEDTRFVDLLVDFKKALIEDMSFRIHKEYNTLYTYITHKIDKRDDEGNYTHLSIHTLLKKLRNDLEKKFDEHCEELRIIDDLSNDEIVSEGLDIYSRVRSEMFNFNLRYRIILNADKVHAVEQLTDELGNVYENLTTNYILKHKALESLNEYHKFSDEKLRNLLPKLEENDQSLAELQSQVNDLLDEIDAGNLKIADLNQKIQELSKPLQFFGAGSIATAGNSISMFYYKRYGYKLDCINWTETETGYELLYAIRQNPSLTADDLYQDNNREQLASFTNSLHKTFPQFDFNYQNCTLTLKVVLRPAPKKDNSKADIDKIWVPASKFENYVRNWERVRITAGSTGGKSPTAKNLALAIMKGRKGVGEIKLYDPQHGSKKDYWNMPKSGTSHEHNLAGMTELCRLIDQRRGTKNNPFILYLFDEVDNTVTQLKEGSKFRDLIKVSLKESSHADIGVIYIGQSADANEVPGMTHSNWGNAIQLHIGSNAGSWIDSAKMLTTEDKTRLLEQYRKIQEFCDNRNEELGLDIFTDATAYRFALAVPLTGLPKFIQLPDFDSYDYYEVMSINSTQHIHSVNSLDNTFVERTFEEIKPQIECPKCGSTNIGTKGEDYHRCRDCNKTWVKPKIDLGF